MSAALMSRALLSLRPQTSSSLLFPQNVSISLGGLQSIGLLHSSAATAAATSPTTTATAATTTSTSSSSSTAPTAPPTPTDSQTLTLPDGRQLGFAEYGPPDGTPLFYFHGYPSCRLEAQSLARLARRQRIRIVSPDRPGFGLSSPHPHTRRRRLGPGSDPGSGPGIGDWARDVVALADHLRIDRFAVLGCSGGGPYAVACAHSVPPARLLAVGALAPSAPWVGDGVRDLKWSMRLCGLLARRFPAVLTYGYGAFLALANRVVDSERSRRSIDAWVRKQQEKPGSAVSGKKGAEVAREAGKEEEEGKKEKGEEKEEDEEEEEEGDPEARVVKARETMVRDAREAFRQGMAGFVRESRLLSSDWNMDLAAIPARLNVQIYHGTQDQQSPIRLVRALARGIPGAQLTEYPDTDHFKIGHHLNDIFKGFMDKARTEKP